MEYIEQSFRDLRLLTSNKVVDINQFELISEITHVLDGMDVHFGILGESHFVSVTSGEMAHVEILACTDAIVPGMQVYTMDKILGKFTTENLNKGFTYEFSIIVQDTGGAQEQINKIKAKHSEPNTIYLTHTFPSDDERYEAAITEIVLTCCEEVLIETIHTYPNENKVVFSQSTLTRK